ncbi:MAG: hypothetical protein B6D68_03305 [spirochete symbiont of Stewartia floridana]|nr:MAG: hypothetical protein B6D68_03305 [spirochete symbiont of Stewartia floridana]
MDSFKNLMIGDQAEITGYNDSEKSYRRELLAMGLTRGTVFTLTKAAPLGDPVEIEVRGYRLSMRKDEANVLKIRKLWTSAEQAALICRPKKTIE